MRAGKMIRALVVALVVQSTAAAAEVATVRLTALCDTGDRKGTGFVVKSWLGGDYLLMTALHVVDHCAGIKIEKVACEASPPTQNVGTLGGETKVWSWPTRDVAAIEISAAEKQRFIGARAAASLPGDETPALGDELAVLGTSETNPCSGGVGFATGTARIDNLMATAAGGIDVPELRGSLDAALRVLLYFSPVAHGVSGGPVARLHTNTVIGVHDGGIEHFPFGWSIALGKNGSALGDAVPGTLAAWPPGFRAPRLAQADEHALPDGVRDEVQALERRYKRQPYIFSFSLPFEFSVAGKELPSWRFAPQLGFITELAHWPRDTAANAFGFRVAGGAIAGQARQRLIAPDGTRFELHDVSRYGAFAEGAFHLRFRRLSWWRLSFDLGLRASIVGWEGSFASDLYSALSVPARVRASFSRTRYHAATVELSAMLDYDPGSDWRYRPSGQLVAPDFRVSFGLGVGVGYEY